MIVDFLSPARLGGAALLMLGAAGPIAAQQAVPDAGPDLYAWGARSVAYIRIEPAPDHPATVVFVNRLTFDPDSSQVRLTMDGMEVDVILLMGPGDEPDVIRVLPPPGFMAEPESISVEEGETGRIQILYLPMS